MERPDFDANAPDSEDAADNGNSSTAHAHFGADTPKTTNLSALHHADETGVDQLFGTQSENNDGAS